MRPWFRLYSPRRGSRTCRRLCRSDTLHPIGPLAVGSIAGALFVWGFNKSQLQWIIDGGRLWGGIAAGIFGFDAFGGLSGVTFLTELIRLLTDVAIATALGFIVYRAFKITVGLRLHQDAEFLGADLALHNIRAYLEEDLQA
ncbi:MAG: ammonium transporter [Magnetovibrio sp.]|nr:ammonium transporter [Magnetovibrio sp.]